MEFTCDRNLLVEAVVNAASGIPANPVQPIRAGMHVELTPAQVLVFTGSDGDVTFKSRCPFTIPYKEGETTVPGRLFAEIVRSLSGEKIYFEATREMVTVICGRSVFKLRAQTEPYPKAGGDCKIAAPVSGEDFSVAVKAVIPAASRKDGNPALHGLLLEPTAGVLTLIATDRYRVAKFEIVKDWKLYREPSPGRCVIPTWAADRFRRGITSLNIDIGWDENLCTMSSADFRLTTKQIAGVYADWRRFFTDERPQAEVNVEGLTAAVKRAQLVADQDDPVQLSFTSGEVRVSAGDAITAKEALDADYKGEEFTALFGAGLLLDGLTGCDGENVSFGFTGSLKPVRLTSGRFSYVILPRRRT